MCIKYHFLDNKMDHQEIVNILLQFWHKTWNLKDSDLSNFYSVITKNLDNL